MYKTVRRKKRHLAQGAGLAPAWVTVPPPHQEGLASKSGQRLDAISYGQALGICMQMFP